MKITKQVWLFAALLVAVLFFGIKLFAQDATPDIPLADFISGLITDAMNLKASGGSKVVMVLGGVALLVRALLSTMKVSVLRAKLWDKLSTSMQGLVPLILTVILAALAALGAGQPITLQAVAVALFTGAGASKLHDLLQYIEALPGINSVVKLVVSVGEALLGGKQA